MPATNVCVLCRFMTFTSYSDNPWFSLCRIHRKAMERYVFFCLNHCNSHKHINISALYWEINDIITITIEQLVCLLVRPTVHRTLLPRNYGRHVSANLTLKHRVPLGIKLSLFPGIHNQNWVFLSSLFNWYQIASSQELRLVINVLAKPTTLSTRNNIVN